jgi:glutamate racemase
MALGILDWGVGGLGFYRLLRAARPHASVLYWSDAGVTPYGRMERSVLRERVGFALNELVRHGASELVVACNAASTVLSELELDVPLLGVIEPAIAAVPRNLTGTLAVLGGVRTIRSRLYQEALRRADLQIIGRVAQPLSAHIEAGRGESEACARDVARIMAKIGRSDAILLACTHYPAIAHLLRPHAPAALWIDPCQVLLEAVLARFAVRDTGGETRFITSGCPVAMARAAASAWRLALGPVEQVEPDSGLIRNAGMPGRAGHAERPFCIVPG